MCPVFVDPHLFLGRINQPVPRESIRQVDTKILESLSHEARWAECLFVLAESWDVLALLSLSFAIFWRYAVVLWLVVP